ncbi:Thiol-disulfide oxidoreductase ResA [Oligella sp. MSHR50489EDL]|uniref:TlpA family protein disulfide reductase n=1 Tax=Oligella sp. MSHR50489EDL TaxID=3139409 RepID=UPI003D8148F5
MVIGPFLLPPMVFATLIGVLVLMLLGALLKRFIAPRFDSWVGLAVVLAFVAARMGFVLRHLDSYQQNPLRFFYIWQGGFDSYWAIAAAVLSLGFLKTWRHRGIGLAALILSAAFIYLTFSLTPKPASKQLPDISLLSLNHERINLNIYAHNKVVINLWATWCVPCRREMPMLQQAVADYADVQFYLINQGEAEDVVRNYLNAHGLKLHNSVLLDPSHTIAGYYKTLGTPVTLFFNQNMLVAMHVGEISAELLSDRLKALRP